MEIRYLRSTLVFLVLFSFAATGPAQTFRTDSPDLGGGEDVVLQWNRVMMATLAVPGQQPATVFNARTTSMVHLAMFDAVNSIDGGYTKYLTEVPGTKNASAEAAAAQAAHDVLVALFPTRVAIFAAELELSLEGIDENRARQGRTIGAIAAANMIAARSSDGWSATPPVYVLPTTPGNWQPTPPANAAASFTHFGNVLPFGTTSSVQFTPNPPPAMTSAQYAADLNEAKSLGKSDSITRTADQTQIAQVWVVGPGVTWNNVARNAAIAKGNSLIENARLFALLQMTFHDSLQATFTSKYTYGLWRPIHAIRRADEDGNASTEADPTWNSLIVSPPYPTYAGNAAGHGMGQATILAQFFGRDDIPVTINFTSPVATRSYPGFVAIADEQARSRIYGGIHFTFDSSAGQSIGRNVANFIFGNLLRPKCTL